MDLLPKVRIEIVVDDPQAERGSEAICRAAKSGRIGDGKISVSTIDHAVRIRTGELDVNAF